MSTEVNRNYVNTPSIRHGFDLGKNALWKWGSGTHSLHRPLGIKITTSDDINKIEHCENKIIDQLVQFEKEVGPEVFHYSIQQTCNRKTGVLQVQPRLQNK